MGLQKINKNVTQEDLDKIFIHMEGLNKKINSLATEIFHNETQKKVLAKPSHLVFSIVHRALELNRGFVALMKTNNWLTAINLIRLQQDNCMRLFALFLVDDKLSFYQSIVNGEQIRNLKDSRGKKMTDLYLSTELDKISHGFRQLYSNLNGFIHFSREHIDFNTDRIDENGNFLMRIRLSEPTDLPVYKKVDYAYNMFYTGKELQKLLNTYKLGMIKVLKKKITD